ncbi:MAG: hypothetical protein ACUVQF_02200 [Fervidobacterium sp.]|uniref:hypothetical protein n=1 Tax=Fervidobacterium sp. TaxID=1871331 RepID=UPI00404B29DF
MKKILSIFLILLTFSGVMLGQEFYFNTKYGFGLSGTHGLLSYTLGFPYSEIGFKIPIDANGILSVNTQGGYDFQFSTYSFKLTPILQFYGFSIGVPLELSTKYVESQQATETGRMNVGINFSAKYDTIMINIFASYSMFYLYYDPAFNVNVPTVYTENIFRSILDFKISYVQSSYSLGIGYSLSVRWLPYRSTFITGQDGGYIEGRFSVKF